MKTTELFDGNEAYTLERNGARLDPDGIRIDRHERAQARAIARQCARESGCGTAQQRQEARTTWRQYTNAYQDLHGDDFACIHPECLDGYCQRE